MSGTGDLLVNYLELANARTLADPDVRTELVELRDALNRHDDQARDLARLRTRIEHLEEQLAPKP